MISNQNKMDKVLSYKNPMYDLSYLFSICSENEPSENYILSKINDTCILEKINLNDSINMIKENNVKKINQKEYEKFLELLSNYIISVQLMKTDGDINIENLEELKKVVSYFVNDLKNHTEKIIKKF